MKLENSLEELSASISLIIIECSDIIWKQNLAGELQDYDKNDLSVFFNISHDVTNIQRMLHEIIQEILSNKRSFDIQRHQKILKSSEPYINFFCNKKEVIILLHGAAHVSYCVCKRIMDDFDDDDSYNKEVYIFLNNLKDFLYLLGRFINNFRIYNEPKYLY